MFIKIFLPFLFLYYIFFGFLYVYNTSPKGDEVHYLITAISILKDKDLDINNQYEARVYKNWYDFELDKHSVKGRDNGQYLYHGLGMFQVILAFGYLFFERYGVSLLIVFISTFLIYFLYKNLLLITKSKKSSIYITVLASLSLPFMQYSFLAFPEMLGAFIVTVIIFFINNKSNYLVLSLLIGILPWIHLRFFPLALGFMFMNFLLVKKKRNVFYSLFSLIIFLSYFLFLFIIFGNFDPRYAYKLAGVYIKPSNIIENIIMSLTDGQYGLFIASPFYCLAFMGFIFWIKNNRKSFLIIIVPVILYMIFTFSYYDWHGGYSPPARYLVVVIPFLAISAAFVINNLSKWARILIFVIGILWGQSVFVINFLQAPNYGFLYFDGVGPFFDKITAFYYTDKTFKLLHLIYLLIFILISIAVYKIGKKRNNKLF